MRPKTVLRLDRQTRFRVIDGEAVVVLQRRAEALVLNHVGTRLLELVDGRRTVADLCAAAAADYAVDRERVESDALPYLEALLAAGVVESLPAPLPPPLPPPLPTVEAP
jgi:hypothetical protein